MIAENLNKVRDNIDAAKGHRDPDKQEDVLLVAVTKNHDIQAMREAIDAGITDIGENRIQEAKEKFETLDRQVTWHLIGHLQTNKAKQAVKIFDLIHSIDSLHLAEAVNNAASGINKIQKILVQVNLAQEESKFGIYEDDLKSLLYKVDEMSNLELMGLMCIAPNYDDVEECRPLFAKMYEIFKKVKEMDLKKSNIIYLSMGMTHDYQIAVEEGANIVRVGTGIFGPRQY
ncbi:MAG: YggS family pyridoxal phosphate-dependent enzyme [Anaerovibrio sp.]|uniref:YggS family pyridoxal phosphate-dependent enzyme n=1 Tax=uncultured Anaerovibrio sp. TaxID=361586 RepID=UPI001B5756B5|nr:YggS family pyridoxal phosphate-dependent enzyme [uncultured Anaerovibrio sp.]MBP3231092.1 YggS family pyridoxal phosphate-dependent enzyme [Anaerovibrio sp.]